MSCRRRWRCCIAIPTCSHTFFDAFQTLSHSKSIPGILRRALRHLVAHPVRVWSRKHFWSPQKARSKVSIYISSSRVKMIESGQFSRIILYPHEYQIVTYFDCENVLRALSHLGRSKRWASLACDCGET